MDAVNIQEELDKWLAENPQAQKYVSKLWHLIPGQPVPADVTHKIALQSETSAERALAIGCVVVPEFAMFLDMLLAMIATNPGGSIPVPPM